MKPRKFINGKKFIKSLKPLFKDMEDNIKNNVPILNGGCVQGTFGNCRFFYSAKEEHCRPARLNLASLEKGEYSGFRYTIEIYIPSRMNDKNWKQKLTNIIKNV